MTEFLRALTLLGLLFVSAGPLGHYLRGQAATVSATIVGALNGQQH
jgi:hypothetical protein